MVTVQEDHRVVCTYRPYNLRYLIEHLLKRPAFLFVDDFWSNLEPLRSIRRLGIAAQAYDQYLDLSSKTSLESGWDII